MRFKTTLLQVISVVCLSQILLLLDVANTLATQPKMFTVSMRFEYGLGFSKHFNEIKVTENATILDSMRAMQKHRFRITYKSKGSGTLTFISEIDMIRNEGNGKNWIVYINGERAKVGVGAYQLKANDSIVWKYETFQ